MRRSFVAAAAAVLLVAAPVAALSAMPPGSKMTLTCPTTIHATRTADGHSLIVSCEPDLRPRTR